MKTKFYQFLGLTKRAGKLLEGYNKCEDGIKHNKVKLIILAEDLAQNTKDKFSGYCSTKNIYLIGDVESEALNSSIGALKVGVLGVTDEKMSLELIKIWKELINN